MKKILYLCSKKNKFLLLKDALKKEYSVYRAEDLSEMEKLVVSTRFLMNIVEFDDFFKNSIKAIILSRKRCSELPVLIIGKMATNYDIAEAMKAGASDYCSGISKIDEIKMKIEEFRQESEEETENSLIPELIGESSFIKDVKKTLSLYAENDFNLCIYGETGTGKGLLASMLHRLRYGTKRPFISRNCSAIPETLFEAEAFGSEKGAFTGAVQRKGFFEQAKSGTLFLDEIGELPLSLQGKLLKVIEEKKVIRVGGAREYNCPCSVFSATNKDLKLQKDKGLFRPDLYYRINTLTIRIPPLRERKEDIPHLVDFFVSKTLNREELFEKKRISDSAMNLLIEHSWPGNIRELEMTVNRALVHSCDSQWIKTPHILLE